MGRLFTIRSCSLTSRRYQSLYYPWECNESSRWRGKMRIIFYRWDLYLWETIEPNTQMESYSYIVAYFVYKIFSKLWRYLSSMTLELYLWFASYFIYISLHDRSKIIVTLKFIIIAFTISVPQTKGTYSIFVLFQVRTKMEIFVLR